jgi:uncharacterized RDD family membrane protein YckC
MQPPTLDHDDLDPKREGVHDWVLSRERRSEERRRLEAIEKAALIEVRRNPGRVGAQLGLPLYAGFWRRAAAALVDGLVLAIPMAMIELVLYRSFPQQAICQLLCWWLYRASMESSAWQATVGKRAVAIKVVDLDGERISFARATGRYCSALLSMATWGLGFAMAGGTRRRQALHDLLADTLVVNAAADAQDVRAGGRTMGITAAVWLAAFALGGGFILGVIASAAIPLGK